MKYLNSMVMMNIYHSDEYSILRLKFVTVMNFLTRMKIYYNEMNNENLKKIIHHHITNSLLCWTLNHLMKISEMKYLQFLCKYLIKIPHRDESQVQVNQNWNICSTSFLNLTILWYVHRHFCMGVLAAPPPPPVRNTQEFLGTGSL